MGYTKLFNEIIASTVWREPDHVRLLWITMLALRDRNHKVEASVPGLADFARISLEECEEALKILSSPDPYSRSKEAEGRRIEATDGGWYIINGEKYRNKMSADERREYQRIKQKEYRDKKAFTERLQNCQRFTQTEEESETKTYTTSKEVDMGKNPCVQYQEIVDLYHDILADLPRVAKLTKTRKGQIRQRWISDEMNKLEKWENFFNYVKQSDFLMGRTDGSNGKPPFVANLEWLTKQSNFIKIAEGRYHRV